MMLEPESTGTVPPSTATVQNQHSSPSCDLQSADVAEKSATKVAQKPPQKRDGVEAWMEWHKQRRQARQKRSGGQTVEEWCSDQRRVDVEPREPDWALAKPELWTPSLGDLLAIFYPRLPVPEGGFLYTESICNLLAVGALSCHLVTVPLSSAFYPLRSADERFIGPHARESVDHRSLKILGLGWLRSVMGARYAATEVGTIYGKADVFSADLRIAVECGNTDPYRILRMARYGELNGILVLPYDAHTDESLAAVLFRRVFNAYLTEQPSPCVPSAPNGGTQSEQ